jgi:hypothetical protein
MPPPIFEGNCGYTPITSIGTFTLNPGYRPPNPPNSPGVFYGYVATSTGTAAMVVNAYDVQVIATGTGTTTTTNTLMSGTATAPNQQLIAGIAGVGVRYRGDLVIVTSGTAGGGLSLWD